MGGESISQLTSRSFFALIVFLGLSLLPCGAMSSGFDLTDWVLEDSREFSLAGDWLYIPERLVEPLNLSLLDEEGRPAKLPSFYGEEKSGNPASHGFGTYVTQVRLPEFARSIPMVLRFTPADTAGRFVVTDLDGSPLSPVVDQGRVGTT